MLDKLGHVLEIGDVVLLSDQHSVGLLVGRVTGFTTKNVRLDIIRANSKWKQERLSEPHRMAAITGEDALMYVLRNG